MQNTTSQEYKKTSVTWSGGKLGTSTYEELHDHATQAKCEAMATEQIQLLWEDRNPIQWNKNLTKLSRFISYMK